MQLHSANKSSAHETRAWMTLCEEHNSTTGGTKIPALRAIVIAALRCHRYPLCTESNHHGQIMPCLNLAPKAICIGPLEPDRACSTHALLVPHSTDPVTGARSRALGKKCSELGGTPSKANCSVVSG